MEIDRLLAAKRAGVELDQGPRIEPISRFVERELARWETQEIVNLKPAASADKIDDLFRESLAEVWQL